MQRMTSFFAGFLLIFMIGGCQSYQEQQSDLPDTPYRGTVRVSADETFKPIVEELVQVYESNHPGTSILVTYKTEAACFNDLMNDSVRLLFVTRRPSAEEKQLVVDSLEVSPKSMVVARDGIAVIVHPSSFDTLFTMSDIRQILTGKYNKKLIPVFDGVKATSTVRFIVDSVLRGEPLTPEARGTSSSQQVIEYVADHPGAIGFVGIGWIGNPEDTTQLSFLKTVKVANVESTDKEGLFVKAYQANIHRKRYPMVRDIMYVLKERHKGLGTGFANFVSGELGQIIFRRGYLAPAQKNLEIRPVRLIEE